VLVRGDARGGLGAVLLEFIDERRVHVTHGRVGVSLGGGGSQIS
jgi:hypothetical protein